MNTIIKVQGISKFYRIGHETVKALKDVNLEIEKGEICCILGTSGSGKSTLLNQLAGLEKPTKGCVYIGKTNISRLSENQLAGFRQKHIGFVFQSYNLLPSMTAMENVAMPLLFKGTSRAKRDSEAQTMLKKVGLGTRMHHKPSEMSGGQQQRVGIARAFVAHPKIVFADEPTGNLDSRTTIEVVRLLIDMAHQHGITFVLVTHDNELATYADRIITIKDGVVISDRKNPKPAYLISDEQFKKEMEKPDEELSSKNLSDLNDSDDLSNNSDGQNEEISNSQREEETPSESLQSEKASENKKANDCEEKAKQESKVNSSSSAKTDILCLIKSDLKEKSLSIKKFINSHRKEQKQ